MDSGRKNTEGRLKLLRGQSRGEKGMRFRQEEKGFSERMEQVGRESGREVDRRGRFGSGNLSVREEGWKIMGHGEMYGERVRESGRGRVEGKRNSEIP